MKSTLVLTFLLVATLAHGATTLLSDSFSRGTTGTPVVLNGSSPTFSLTPETWTAFSNIKTNGTTVVLPNNYNATTAPFAAPGGYISIPSLALTGSDLTVGATYELSFSLSAIVNPGYGGTSAGFGTLVSTNNVSYQGGNQGSFYAFDNQGHIVINYEVGTTGTVTTLSNTTISGGSTATVDMLLTAGAGNNDTVTAYVNGVKVVNAAAVHLDPIQQIFVDSLTATGNFDNMLLTTTGAVPEPSTWAMLFGGLALLAGMGRFRALRV